MSSQQTRLTTTFGFDDVNDSPNIVRLRLLKRSQEIKEEKRRRWTSHNHNHNHNHQLTEYFGDGVKK